MASNNHSSHSASLFEDEHEDDPKAWLVTYADMVTLLLAFFVVLNSYSKTDEEKFKMAVSSIQTTITSDAAQQLGFVDTEINIYKTKEQKEAHAIYKKLEELIETQNLAQQLEANLDETRIIIRLKDSLVFTSGSAKLNPLATPIFDEIIILLSGYPDYDINIKGHTDNVPINTPQFPSNWELSAIRATTVLRYFIDNAIDPMRLTATGYGDIIPIEENNSAHNRAINRRVEFVLEKNENRSKQTIKFNY